jgi:hypothetical protein
MTDTISQINDDATRKFAAAIYASNTIGDIIDYVGPGHADCVEWGLTEQQWLDAVAAAFRALQEAN